MGLGISELRGLNLCPDVGIEVEITFFEKKASLPWDKSSSKDRWGFWGNRD